MELIGSGVDMSLHSSIPVEIEGKITRGEIEMAIRTPSETMRSGRQTETLHVFVMPHSFKYNFLQVTPITHSLSMKKISAGIKRQPIEMEIGQSLGLSAQLKYKSEAMFTDLYSYIQKIIQHTPLSVIPSGLFPSSVKMSSFSINYHPARSQTKEFNIVLRLSTKGMMHSLSKMQISENQISSELSHVRGVLSQLEKANVVEITGMTKSSGLTFEGKFMLPELRNRFNIEKMLEEPLRGIVEAKLSFGESSNMKTVKVHAEFEKTEELKREIRESPEFKKCMIEQRRQQVLSPICNLVRSQAGSLDKVHITIDTPKSWARSSFMTLLDSISKTLLIGNIESEELSTGVEGRILVEARAERTSNLVAIAKVQTPSRKIVLKNLRLMGYTQSVFPASRLYTPLEVVALKMTGNRMPSTCRVEPTFVRTFDNKTVEYKINDCEHVLLLDGSKHIPMAVTTRTVSGSEKKIVKILSGIIEAQIIPSSSGSLKVLINKEEVHPMVGQKLVKKTSQGKIIAIVQRFEDNVVSVYVPEQGLKVLSNGSRIEVVAPQLLKSRTVGLCVMRPRL